MRAAQFQGPGYINIIDAPVPEPGENQVRIKLQGCGICGSNIPVWEGRDWFKYPTPAGKPGHEGWGVIDKTGPNVKTLKEGDRVTMLSYSAFAEYDISNDHSAVKIPDNFDLFPGEPLGCVINIFKRSQIKKNDIVAIIGIGFLGAMLTQLSAKTGAEVIAISRRDYSLQIASELGAHHLIKMDDHWKIISEVKKITGGKFCNNVIEAVGLQWPLDLAGELTGERGKLIIAGYHQDSPRSVNMQLWNWRGIDVINAHERSPELYVSGMDEAVKAVSDGILTPEILYKEFPLSEINEAFTSSVERPDNFVKAVIRI